MGLKRARLKELSWGFLMEHRLELHLDRLMEHRLVDPTGLTKARKKELHLDLLMVPHLDLLTELYLVDQKGLMKGNPMDIG